jgi:hypothetical protein
MGDTYTLRVSHTYKDTQVNLRVNASLARINDISKSGA